MTLNSRLPNIAATLDEEIDSALRKLAEGVVREAIMRVPVDEGTLRSAIHIEREDDANYRVIAGDDEAFYGHIVEFGGSNVDARPFLIPAFEAQRAKVTELVKQALADL